MSLGLGEESFQNEGRLTSFGKYHSFDFSHSMKFIFQGFYCNAGSESSQPMGMSYGDTCPMGKFCPAGSGSSMGKDCPRSTYSNRTGT